MHRLLRSRPRDARPTTRTRATPQTATHAALSCCALTVMSPLALSYVVEPGDTVSEIAARHGTTVGRIVGANDLPAGGSRIYTGETLRIPSAHAPGHQAARSPANTANPSRPSSGGADGNRRIVWHRVQPGDTMTEIAVRYHAWTDELVAANGGSTSLQVGERVKVPVVVSRAGGDPGPDAAPPPAPTYSAGTRHLQDQLDEYADPSRATVRRMITRTARREGVDPDLALAVSWQEAGWQQHHVSGDKAIGAMQIIPSTGDWVSGMVGRDLNLMRVRDNVTAGVVLLGYLTDVASTRRAVAGYYQGLAGVREHGMYDDTKAYVRNVLALKQAFDRGDYPG